MLSMNDFAGALRRAFPSEPFTAADALAKLAEADVPGSLQYVVQAARRGHNVHPVRSMGRHLLSVGAVKVGKTRSGVILWTAPTVL